MSRSVRRASTHEQKARTKQHEVVGSRRKPQGVAAAHSPTTNLSWFRITMMPMAFRTAGAE